jgi:putative FmdB family regulatory protein
MPFYEYRCGGCGLKFEHFARNTSDDASSCPDCGCADIKKLFSVFGFKSGSASGGDFHSSAGGSGCGSCTSSSCSSCMH